MVDVTLTVVNVTSSYKPFLIWPYSYTNKKCKYRHNRASPPLIIGKLLCLFVFSYSHIRKKCKGM